MDIGKRLYLENTPEIIYYLIFDYYLNWLSSLKNISSHNYLSTFSTLQLKYVCMLITIQII